MLKLANMGESRDPFCRIALVEEWIPAFAGMTNRAGGESRAC